MIEIKELSKHYGNKQVISSLSLQFEKGKVYGIVGENGAGKTTLFRCIADLESYKGSIVGDKEPLKNHLGFLETNPSFMSRLTGWEYLKLFSIARGLKEDDFESQNYFDLPLNEYAQTYSTGMKKKLALMAILLQKNDYFILDEPFNGVDLQSNIIIADIINRLKKANKVVLISSHIYSSLSVLCDRIFLLKNGQVVEEATKEQFDQLENKMKEGMINSENLRFGFED